ncbi:MAG TPA: cellulose synthase operon protein YhjQ/BcsQ [Pirellulales bacterium]|jgi:cellulose synthase operon protein YhjQ
MPLICLASPKGGVGKTTFAANIAGGIARSGGRVIALDLDPQNTLRFHFGVPLTTTDGFASRITQRPNWRMSLCSTAIGVGVLPYGLTDLVTATQLAAAVLESPDLLTTPVRQILAEPDLTLVVDTPPGPSTMLSALLPIADLLVTVLLVDATSMSLLPALDSGSVYGQIGEHQQPINQGFVLNQFDPRTRLGAPIATAASRHFGERLLGVVYRDEHVAEAVAAQKLLAEYAPGAKATQDLGEITRAIMARLAMTSRAAVVERASDRSGMTRP